MTPTIKEQWNESGGNWMLALAGSLIVVGFIGIYFSSLWPREFPRSYPRYSDPEEESQVDGVNGVGIPTEGGAIEGGEVNSNANSPSTENSSSVPDKSTGTSPTSLNPGFTISIEGMATDRGTCRIALYDSVETFNDVTKAALKQDLEIQSGKSKWVIPGNPMRAFAVAAYHDENSNNVLDKNALGIPTERYGFSNDARGTMGPPKFADAIIPVTPSAPRELVIRLKGGL